LDEVAAGEEIDITKRGRVVARLVPAGSQQSLRGILAAVATTASSEDDLFVTGAWRSSDT
jgi:prevent-host-death family protein